MPSNLSYHHLNVFEPVPEEYKGKYDVVHIRFFTPVVRNGDPGSVIRTALDLLSRLLFTVRESLADK